MVKFFLLLGSILGGLSVAGGAFASHALKERLTERSLEIFDLAARYQMYHALALLLVGILLSQSQIASPFFTASGIAFILGVLLFSGSLYALSLSGIKILGAVTPLGGVALIAGWVCLAIGVLGIR
jgi:uncharacterized membrane protein YgdD (TMEM256/DUF423 family)